MGALPGWGPPSWHPVPEANTLRLALCLLLLGSPQCTPAQPVCREEEFPAGSECCPKCNPGFHVRRVCSEVTGTECSPCPAGTYTAHSNGLRQCLRCRDCEPDMGLVTGKRCSSTQDTTCDCSQGHFCKAQEGDHCVLCEPHTTCHPGQRVKERGTSSRDTLCADCPLGTFSPNGTLDQCLPWTRCSGWLQGETEPGTSSKDVTCSFSWASILVPCFSVIVLVLILLGAIWIWKKKKCSPGYEAPMTNPNQERRGGAEDPEFTEALQPLPDVTTVAVEETAPVLREKDPHR
ncbi:PREDICTED: tumor necrosis factor receptor superfamily member 14 isoform X1 [Chinchilla lanigera]|uniref:TNFR-Cys domain-containing protein n=1 Tax=Chinchilla lanigera TaxID=34839 RepID=A0A8C2V2R8_CHILA|nr:PREDICTED: tumor necrosis factor receptor superfamily member 14 isoform X1 [Chinchilla lanigera]XP_013359696.1 PREDICTED: tumor necrosis factor receptor superfamily member 14 isoform X1 [Chinchilla lanigera]XP_013359697.1 PREDICTED: tumor necrosis factor receptor superfamily member 14 isoform X1 [Chinchilla lanigera]XP_013359698.1 PREDICTED: tumor necrosis factor receptor superfamily member 14 isoform X1 [Chinchilla lanigera]